MAALLHFVIAGLDPAIHHLAKWMDARVKFTPGRPEARLGGARP
jgi:hypothetical protein